MCMLLTRCMIRKTTLLKCLAHLNVYDGEIKYRTRYASSTRKLSADTHGLTPFLRQDSSIIWCVRPGSRSKPKTRHSLTHAHTRHTHLPHAHPLRPTTPLPPPRHAARLSGHRLALRLAQAARRQHKVEGRRRRAARAGGRRGGVGHRRGAVGPELVELERRRGAAHRACDCCGAWDGGGALARWCVH